MTDGRHVTSGEVAMLQAVYGTRIPYSVVMIYPRRWMWPFPQDRSMAPNGNVYMPGTEYANDYSNPAVDLYRRSTFVHEFAHIYQWYVIGETVWLRGPFNRTYDYVLLPGKKWSDYGLEQMAMIAQDWWLLKHGGRTLNPTQYPVSAYANLMPVK